MKQIALAFAVLLGSACGCSSKSPTPSTEPAPPVTTDPAPTPSNTEPSTTQAGSAAAGPGIGEKCGAGDVCGAGTTCVSYFGIAGARGPEFKTCEIKCEDDSACPKDRKCATIADGPGRVCR
jgi:hypothetical protein